MRVGSCVAGLALNLEVTAVMRKKGDVVFRKVKPTNAVFACNNIRSSHSMPFADVRVSRGETESANNAA